MSQVVVRVINVIIIIIIVRVINVIIIIIIVRVINVIIIMWHTLTINLERFVMNRTTIVIRLLVRSVRSKNSTMVSAWLCDSSIRRSSESSSGAILKICRCHRCTIELTQEAGFQARRAFGDPA